MAHGHWVEGCLAGEVTYEIMPFHHATGGAAAVQLVAYTLLVAVASLAPDIDHPKSRISTSLGPITGLLSFLVIRFAKFVYYLTQGPADPQHTDGHRALTHTPVAGAVVAAGVWLAIPGPWAAFYASSLLVGWLTHLFGDSCSNSGIPVFAPLRIGGASWRHHGIPHWMRFKTGGHGAHGGWQEHGESIVTFAVTGLCFVAGAFYVDPHLLPQIVEAL
jgi:membrane-bound metal-dependent hydrolase YbcI (DUF457 family)